MKNVQKRACHRQTARPAVRVIVCHSFPKMTYLQAEVSDGHPQPLVKPFIHEGVAGSDMREQCPPQMVSRGRRFRNQEKNLVVQVARPEVLQPLEFDL